MKNTIATTMYTIRRIVSAIVGPVVIVFLATPGLQAQTNIPDGSGLPSGSLTGEVSTPANYNASPNTAPARFNYVRQYVPLEPMNVVPGFDATAGMAVQVSTTYTDGYGQPLQTVHRTNRFADIITPYYSRPGKTSVSYLPYEAVHHSRFRQDAFTAQKSYYNAKYAAEGNTAYSKTAVASDHGRQVATDYAPGAAMVGQQRGTTTYSRVNGPNEVRLLTAGMGSVTSLGYYDPGTLNATVSLDQHGQTAVSFHDLHDVLVCKKEYAGAGQGSNGWLETYYIYDEMGRITAIVPPKASIQLISASSIANADQLCFFYGYDHLGRIAAKSTPGKSDAETVIYDRRFRPVFSQTPLLKAQNRYAFTIYDASDRVLMSGIYDNSNANLPQDTLRRILSAGSGTSGLLLYLSGDLSASAAYPSSIPDCDIQVYNYYDSYSHLPSPADARTFSGAFAADYRTGAQMVTPAPYGFMHGRLVGSRTKMTGEESPGLFPNTWITTVLFYDEKGRVIQAHTLNPWNTSAWDISAVQYDFSGKVVWTGETHNSFTGSDKPATTIQVWNNYHQRTGELLETRQKIDQETWKTIEKNTLSNLGQLTHQYLGDVERRFYDYNIRGQLTAINAAQYAAGVSGFHYTFAEKLHYESGFSRRRYDGKLSGYEWKTPGSDFSAYGYRYDSLGRMTAADFTEYDALTGWHPYTRNFSVSDITYDPNGNILTMRQHGYDTALSPAVIDDFTYTYDAGNRLLRLKDAGVKSPIADFDNSLRDSTVYGYDADGNMTGDDLKGLVIAWNHQGLPLTVSHDVKGVIRNTYDASGTLVQKTVMETADTTVYRYWGPYVYRNDSLQYILHGAGRARWIRDSSYFRYEYFVKDHLGNVRTVVSSDLTPLSSTYLATNEIASANIENAIFENLDEVRDLRPGGEPGDEHSERLNAEEEDRRIGAALMLRVMAGDKITMSAYSYHGGKESDESYTLPEAMLGSLINTLVEGMGGFEGGEENNGYSLIQNALTEHNYSLFQDIKHSVTDPDRYRSYINYLAFDEEFNLLESSGAAQVGAAAHTWELLSTEPVEIEENGYLLIYLSNEELANIYYDNINIIHQNSRLLEEQHYYPHGLLTGKSVAMGVNPENRFQFQGNELQKDLGMELYDFNARHYDQQTGRFIATDPLADLEGQESLSPYHFCANDPANYTDPLGLNPPGLKKRQKQQMQCSKPTSDSDDTWWDRMFGWIEELFDGGGHSGGGADNGSGGQRTNGWGYATGTSISVYTGGDTGGGGEVAGSGNTGGSTGTGSGGYPGVVGVAPRKNPVKGMKRNLQGTIYLAVGSEQRVEMKAATGGRSVNLGLKTEEQTKGRDWLSPAGRANAGVAASALGLEHTPGSFRLATARQGFSPKYYANAWRGNQYAKTFNIGMIGRLIGYGSVGIGTLVDAYGVYEYTENPNSPNSVYPGKAGFNLGMSAYGVFISGPGALLYFGVDAFHPGGWGGFLENYTRISIEGQRIMGPGWRLVPFGNK